MLYTLRHHHLKTAKTWCEIFYLFYGFWMLASRCTKQRVVRRIASSIINSFTTFSMSTMANQKATDSKVVNSLTLKTQKGKVKFWPRDAIS
ncbi:hypothetical protein BYT27DRAFT_6529124 [Phlegmacium glaucopus]|nr:hypothetical protein BYT27DRAFT_6529124 [Phlegmacium glaucopus]